jgi:hypothetical protein
MSNACTLNGATVIALLGSVILCIAAPPPAAPLSAPDLTPVQKRAISQSIVGNGQFAPPTFHVSIGAIVPQSVELAPLPNSVTDQVPSIRRDDFAALKGQEVLLVRPQDRKVVGVIEDWADASLGG